MANPGIPTSESHNKSIDSVMHEFNGILVNIERNARETRLAMAESSVSDLVVKNSWDIFANAENRILDIRRTPNFHDAYARYRGLSYKFNCTDDINAAQEKITSLPTNHKFKTDHRVDFTIIEGSLPGGLSEGTNYWIRSVDAVNGTITLSTTEGGGSDINLSNGVGMAVMNLNIKPDLSALITAIDVVLDEIEANLVQRATTYNRTTLSHDYSGRPTLETVDVRSDYSDIETLIDIVIA